MGNFEVFIPVFPTEILARVLDKNHLNALAINIGRAKTCIGSSDLFGPFNFVVLLAQFSHDRIKTIRCRNAKKKTVAWL